MKLTLTTTLLTLLVAASAIPTPQDGQQPHQPNSSFQSLTYPSAGIQKEVPEPAMTRSGIVVPFQNNPGMGTKKAKRQGVSADQPAMSISGQVVPYQNIGKAGGMGTKAKRQVSADQPAMSVSGTIVPYQNIGKAGGMGTKKVKRQGVSADQPSMSVNGVVVAYQNIGKAGGMGT